MGIFIDFKKAFDTVYHKILLEKLAFYGVRGVSGALLKLYLAKRSQFVLNGDIQSDTLEIKCGTYVPQGSVIWPILFNMYVNDIVNVSPILKFILFAGDTNVFVISVTR